MDRNNRLMTLDRFVRDICIELGDMDASKNYLRVYSIAIRVLDDFSENMLAVYKTALLTVKDNSTVDMPDDAISPKSLDKYIRIGNNDFVYPLIKSSNVDVNVHEIVSVPQNAFACPEVPESVDVNELSQQYRYVGAGIDSAYYLPHYYGEYYGYHQNRYYGRWYWHEEDPGRVIIDPSGCLRGGDKALLTYKVADMSYNLIKKAEYFMISRRVLQIYWQSINNSKAMMYFDQFRREIRQYKKTKEDFRYEDIIKAFQQGYASSNM